MYPDVVVNDGAAQVRAAAVQTVASLCLAKEPTVQTRGVLVLLTMLHDDAELVRSMVSLGACFAACVRAVRACGT